MIKICCTSYSLRDYFAEEKIDLNKFLEICGRLGMQGVELFNTHFPETGERYLRQLKDYADSLGLEIASVDASNNFAVPSKEELGKQVDHVKEWVEVASKLGAPVIRTFSGYVHRGMKYEAMVRQSIECFRECAHHAKDHGVTLGIENHGNFCNTADEILRIIEEVGSSYLRTVPDVGNFRENRYEQLKKIAPLAVHVHAKMYEFDEKGEETTLNYRIAAKIFKEVHYNRHFSIEFVGKEDQMVGTKKGLALLRRHL